MVMSWDYAPTAELLQYLAGGRLAMRFHRAVRLWVLLHRLYSTESRWITCLTQPFTYPDLRNRLFSEKHPKSDRLNAQAILTGCSDHGCICRNSVIQLLQNHFSPETWEEWQQQLQTLTGWSDTELQQQLGGHPFATVHRSLRDDLKFLTDLGWLESKNGSSYYGVNTPKLPIPSITNTLNFSGLSKTQLWGLLRVLESVAFVQPNLEVVVQSLWEALVEDGVKPIHRKEPEPQQRIFIHFDYILSDENQDQVDGYQEQIELLWRDPMGGVINFKTWIPALEKKVEVTVYPVCLHYVRRAKYLSAFGFDPDGKLGWHNYRLDRIASKYLRVFAWGDRHIPPELQRLKLTESLPNSEDVQIELDAAWGFNFYLPSQLLIMRFNPYFDRWYVDNTDRHPTFKPISYTDLPKLILRHIPNLEEQKAVLEIIRQRSPQDCYYQGWIRVGDINVLMRLREWRGNGEVIAPFSIRQRLHQEALEELSNY